MNFIRLMAITTILISINTKTSDRSPNMSPSNLKFLTAIGNEYTLATFITNNKLTQDDLDLLFRTAAFYINPEAVKLLLPLASAKAIEIVQSRIFYQSETLENNPAQRNLLMVINNMLAKYGQK